MNTIGHLEIPANNIEKVKEFYSNSESTDYWIDKFFKPVIEARRDNIYNPRAKYVRTQITELEGKLIGDMGAGFGIFLEELRKNELKANYVAIEPSIEMASICEKKGFRVDFLLQVN